MEELYEKHDRKALEMKEVMAMHREQTPQGEIKSGEGGQVQRVEEAYAGMMEEMKVERDKLIEHFNKDTDLREKIIITGVK